MYTALVGMVKYAIECENIMVPPSYTEKMLRKIITQMKNIVGCAKNE